MRSYNEIVCDVKDGIPVRREELRVALLFAADQIFFLEQVADRSVNEKRRELHLRMEKRDKETRISVRNAPLEKWFSYNIPPEFTKDHPKIAEIKKQNEKIKEAFQAENFDPKTVLGLWAKKQTG